MRVALVAVLLVHGLIHLIGVAKEWKLAVVPGMSGSTLFVLPATMARSVGALWLTACVGLLAAAVLLASRQTEWWLFAGAAVVLSQMLVVYAWPDAKAGTLANGLLALVVVGAWSSARFERATETAVHALYSRASSAAAAPVEERELSALPPAVEGWLRNAGVVGKPRVQSVRLRQRGELRTAPEQKFMRAEAEQYFAVEPPGFVWQVHVPMFHLPILGRDSYLGGRGRMLITAAGLLPIVDGDGERIDQGTLLRFLGEMVWFPSAALSPYLRWEAIDAHSARATMDYGGARASADFHFDDQGRMRAMSAKRYMGSGPKATLEPWRVSASEWRRMDGIVIPTRGEVGWELEKGYFSYYRWEITELEYDRPASYSTRP